MAKTIIKAVTAPDDLTEDQKQILRRVSMVLIEHGFSVETKIKVTKVKTLKIKVA
jgi:hypothetical protein